MPKGIPKNGINKGWFKEGHIPFMKGKNHTVEAIEKNKQKALTPERIKTSKNNLPNPVSGKDHPSYGTHHSEKTKEKLSLDRLGKKNPKQSQTMKKLYGAGKLKIWNKGLTKETDKRVKINIDKMKEWQRKNHTGKTYEEIFGKERAEKIREELSLKSSLDKNFFWRGGKSFEPYDKSFNNKFKRAIRKRDNQICMLCGIHREKLSRALDVHHIDYNKLLSIPQNCVSLCGSCHALTQINRKHYTKFFQDLLSKLYDYKYPEIQEIVLKLNSLGGAKK